MAKLSKNPKRSRVPASRKIQTEDPVMKPGDSKEVEEDEKELQKQSAMGVSFAIDLMRIKREKKKAKSGGFESLGLYSEIYSGVKRKGYRVPTPIQRKAMGQTGSEKTATFLIPMLQKLRKHVPQAGVRALILSSIRNLTIQTLKFTKELGRFTS